ncbi:hypothetical protein GCM10007973_18390 [Polymorphobacter multimanifer]|uniref:Uncharacterized protein n=1 Tax=Polymorphobacter multimanifer TaxID=1070431 RepID=A0A841LBK1_9SPHN|nr:hypothetical protein [Polymorphobacter multimanifer]MBB6228353.1 hypothetical protein [Polymorphobacter multimanifer]GGI82245.1 hypothetical protein GCM10007973_18390 [Polymorphobacter multimanifer]
MSGIKVQAIIAWVALACSLGAIVWDAAEKSRDIEYHGNRLDKIEASTVVDNRAIIVMQRDIQFLAERARREDEKR